MQLRCARNHGRNSQQAQEGLREAQVLLVQSPSELLNYQQEIPGLQGPVQEPNMPPSQRRISKLEKAHRAYSGY